MKGRALRRALNTTDALRVNTQDVPLIVTTTELITPDTAKAMLQRNNKNRPVNWSRVEQYSELMRLGKWKLHDQGVMLDGDGNILTGQKRLWAVIKSGVNVYMRVSRGNPKDSANFIDRGTPQSARDLASRQTGRVHSPTEASIGRALSVLRGINKPSHDQLAEILEEFSPSLAIVLQRTRGSRKTKEMLMVLGAMVYVYGPEIDQHLMLLPILVDRLVGALQPRTAAECWGRGAAFSLAMEQARRIVCVQEISDAR